MGSHHNYCPYSFSSFSFMFVLLQLLLTSFKHQVIIVEAIGNNILTARTGTTSINDDNVIISYTCSFTNQWSSTRHPFDYPSNAHWSPPFIASHTNLPTGSIWAEDTLATPGIQSVAETGSTTLLNNELDNLESNVYDRAQGSIQYNREKQSQTLPSFNVTKDHHYITSISMLAPSPDWYTGFYDINLVDEGNTDLFYRYIVIETPPYDAGTDSGLTTTSSNVVTSPQDTIFEITPETIDTKPTGMFLNPTQNTVLPVARWECSIDEVYTIEPSEPSPPSPPENNNGDNINIDWTFRQSPYDDIIAKVGDTITFIWEGSNHNVFLHPSGTCDDLTNARELAPTSNSGTYVHTITNNDIGNTLTFTCDVPFHCPASAGNMLQRVIVQNDEPITIPPATTPTPPAPTPDCLGKFEFGCIVPSDCCSGICDTRFPGTSQCKAETAQKSRTKRICNPLRGGSRNADC